MKAATILIDFLFPPQCLACNALIARQGGLCPSCWQAIGFIAPPYCECCGLPFDYHVGEGARCGECIALAPAFARARAVFRYDDASRPLVTKLKYADQTQLAATFGPWLARSGADLLASCDCIVPVPLHYWRFVKRRYNQAALLGRAVSRASGLPVLYTVLKRTRHTKPQPGLTRRQRRRNVKGAFRIPAKGAQRIKGKNILLVDDVMTTSATLSECTRTLLKAGAMQVYVLVLARKV